MGLIMRGPDRRLRKRRWDRGPLSAIWKGGKRVNPATGYVEIIGANGSGKHRREHIMIAEAAIGHVLTRAAMVHHVNEIRTDNRHANLVVLASQSEHMEIHRKMRVRAAGGDPWLDRICCFCKLALPASDFYRFNSRRDGFRYSSYCRPCGRADAYRRFLDRKKTG